MAASLAVAPPLSSGLADSNPFDDAARSSGELVTEEGMAPTPAPAPAVPSMTLPFASARHMQPSLHDLSLRRHIGSDETEYDDGDEQASQGSSEPNGSSSSSNGMTVGSGGGGRAPLHPQLRRIALYLFGHACTLGMMTLAVPALLLELHDDDSSRSAYAHSILGVIPAALGFVVYPLLGTLSDAWGRKPFIVLTLCGAALGYLLVGSMLSWPALLAAAVVRGLTDLSYTMSWAVLGDVTPRASFLETYGRVAGAAGMGIVSGPLFALACNAVGSARLTFLLAAGIELANALFVARNFRETLHYFTRRDAARALMLDAETGVPQAQAQPQTQAQLQLQQSQSQSRASSSAEPVLMPLERESLRSLLARRSLNPFRALRLLARSRALLLLSLSLFFHFIAFSGSLSVLFLFTHERFGWSTVLNGALVFTVGVLSVLANAMCLPAVLKRGWLTERGVLGVSVAATLAFNACLAAVPEGNAGYLLFGAAFIFAPGFFLLSNLRALVSRQLPPQLQGELQGALTCLSSLASIIGPLSLNAIFGYCVSSDAPVYLPGAPFLITFGLNCLCAALIVYVHRTYPGECAHPPSDMALDLSSSSSVADSSSVAAAAGGAVLTGAAATSSAAAGAKLPDSVSSDSDSVLGAPSPRLLHLQQSMIDTRRNSLASDVSDDASRTNSRSNSSSPASMVRAGLQRRDTDPEIQHAQQTQQASRYARMHDQADQEVV